MNMVNNQDTVISKIYTKSDNLQSIEFLYHSKAKAPDGEIFFGGINGFNSFYPEKIVTNPYPPEVHITGLEVANNEVLVNQKIYGSIILDKPVIDKDFIKIPHRIRVFNIKFVGLHFVSPEKNKFAYKLEGYDDQWIETDASVRFASYSNLRGGTYKFKVKAGNNNGVWSNENKVLTIKVIPPFWKTWWFYISVGVALILMVLLFIRQRERQLKKDKEILEKKLQEGDIEINNRKSEIEKQKKAIEEKEQAEKMHKWFNEGLAAFSEILSKEKKDIRKLSQSLISKMVNYVEAEQGGIFLSESIDENQVLLELMAHYAYNAEKLEQVSFNPGEGLIGTCYQQKEILVIDDLPDSYAKINSGLGDTKLKHLLVIPLIYDNEPVGVIEIASLQKIESSKIEFIEKVCESISSVISSIKSNNIINEMLIKTQEQSEELHAQEEEMRQTIEEMKTTQEDIQLRERDMNSELKSLKERLIKLTKINEEQKIKLKQHSQK